MAGMHIRSQGLAYVTIRLWSLSDHKKHAPVQVIHKHARNVKHRSCVLLKIYWQLLTIKWTVRKWLSFMVRQSPSVQRQLKININNSQHWFGFLCTLPLKPNQNPRLKEDKQIKSIHHIMPFKISLQRLWSTK